MQFDLTEALIDQILFSMEDQDADHLLDAREGIVVNRDEMAESMDDDEGESEDDPERFIGIPDWGSADGFRLMERFAAGLRNPIVREELSAALDRGRGVFRAFKDVLSSRPEVERLWFTFKEREMRRVILDWYNALRDVWGLERIGDEPEDTADLVLEDFRFRDAVAEDEEVARELHERCLSEIYRGEDEDILAAFIDAADTKRRTLGAFPGETAMIAETARGDFAAFALVVREGKLLKLTALDVCPEYRGLGVGESLLNRVLESLRDSDARYLTFDLPTVSDSFSRVLIREGFKAFETRYGIDLDRRRRSLE